MEENILIETENQNSCPYPPFAYLVNGNCNFFALITWLNWENKNPDWQKYYN